MQTRFLFLAGLLGLTTLTAQAQQLNTAKLDSLLTTLSTHNKLMGSVMLSQNGKVVYSKAVGYAQLDGATKVPATADTRYRVGSLTKMFTATMIMQLIEEKKLTLATPLATAAACTTSPLAAPSWGTKPQPRWWRYSAKPPLTLSPAPSLPTAILTTWC
jgi:CubicO group peptidase (beta-lactamase class C family)